MNPNVDVADRPARILIVDDEHHNRQLLEIMLTPDGFHLLTAASGEEALAIVTAQHPDLILLDVMMPGMDGYEIAGKIKDNPTTKDIPIIMVTALDDRVARMRGLSVGAEEFLSKPVDRAELRVRVRNLARLKAFSDDKHSQVLESEVGSRTADLLRRTATLEQQAAVLIEQAGLLDLAQDAIVVRDMHHQIIFWSRGAELMYGWRSAEVLGQNPSTLLQTEFLEPIADVEATLLRHELWEGEAVHYTRDGRRLMVASRWALQRDATGTPVRILTITTDVTERKQAEKTLDVIRKEQLRFKDTFLSHVSHELRSPLTAIRQFTAMLFEGLVDAMTPEQCEYQRIVLENIRQLQSMVDDVLEVTRLENGNLTVELESVSMSEAVTACCHTFQETARAKGVTLTSDVPPELPYANTDPTRLRQILIILLDNAIKFTPKGGAVHIQAQLEQDDARFLLIEVSDTGYGINPEIAERLFERHYQGAETLHASRKGLGLGLYICKELVTRLGGRVWVNRRPRQGSIFSLALPTISST